MRLILRKWSPALADVAQLVGALCGKPKGHGLNSRPGLMPGLQVQPLWGTCKRQSINGSLSHQIPPRFSSLKDQQARPQVRIKRKWSPLVNILREKRNILNYSLNELKKQSVPREGVATPVGLQGLSTACIPASQWCSQGRAQDAADQSTLCVKGSIRCSTHSAIK